MLKLIVFDCDGVMFDSREANRAYYNDLLAAFGYRPMNESEVDYVHMHNVSESINYIFRNHPEQPLDAVQQLRRELDYTPYLSRMRMEPDLPNFLDAVQHKYRLAISTNRTNTMRPLLDAFHLTDYFEMIVTAQDVASPKPAPDALFKILDFFHCSPGETIYIGDSIVDRQHTKAADVKLIAFKNQLLPAEYHVENFTEILALPLFRQES